MHAPDPNTLEARLGVAFERTWPWLIPALALLAIQIKWWWIPGDDASVYVSIARHMADGELMRFGEPHLRWAPGYPALLAPAFLVSDRPFLLLALIQYALVVALAFGLLRWFRRVTPAAAAPLAAFVLVNVSLWQLYRMTLGEIAFMVWLVWATEAFHRVLDARRSAAAFGWMMMAALLVVAGGWTRQVAAFLVGGYAIAAALRAWRGAAPRVTWARAIGSTALVGGIVFVAVLALVLWDRAEGRAAGAMSYEQYLADPDATFTQQIVEGMRLRISATGRVMVPGMHKSYADSGVWLHPAVAFYALVSALLAWGWWRVARRVADPLLWTAPIYVAFFVAWPHSQSTRYWVPLLPVLAVALWGLLEPHEGWRRRAVLGLVVAHALVAVGDWVGDLDDDLALHANWARFDRLLADRAPDAGTLAGYGLHRHVLTMLRVDRNAMVPGVPVGDAIDPGVRWVVMPEGVAPPDAFAEVVRADGLVLLERRTSAPTGADARF